MQTRLGLWNLRFGKGFFLAFLVGFTIRLIPEVLSFPHPIGFDTVYYAARMQDGVVWYHWSSVFSTWLLYVVLVPLYKATQVDVFILLKLVGPLLYALSACGVYWFSHKALNWDTRKSLVAALFFAFQLAAFRVSWDLLRNTLGMAILLLALPFVVKMETKKDFAWFVLFSTLVVFSHELASVVMFTVVLGIVLNDLLKENRRKSLKILTAVSPASAIFLTSLYFRIFPLQFNVEPNVIRVSQPSVHPAGLFFLTNYFAGSGQGTTYFDLASHVFSVFIVLYLVCLPLIFVGFFRNVVLDVWTLFLVCASFGCLVMPFFALDFWHRWMFLLVYPFTFYAVNGVMKVFQSESGAVRPGFRWLKWMKISRLTTVGVLSCMVLLASFYVSAPLQSDCYVITALPSVSRYFSVAPTVPLRDVEGTVQVMRWLDERMDDGSCVLVHQAFLSWARLYLNKRHIVVFYVDDVEEALTVAMERGFNSIFLVWWGESIGWYGVTVPDCFSSVFSCGRISVFEYC